jgi:hypothetical protein
MANFKRIDLLLSEAQIAFVKRNKSLINKIVSEECYKENRFALNRGIDTRGKRIPEFSKMYRKRKSSSRGRSQMTKGKKTTSNKAVSGKNYGRLTGLLLTLLKYKSTVVIIGRKAVIKITWSAGIRSRLIKWLEKATGAVKTKKGKKTYRKKQRFYIGVPIFGAGVKRLNKNIEKRIYKEAR